MKRVIVYVLAASLFMAFSAMLGVSAFACMFVLAPNLLRDATVVDAAGSIGLIFGSFMGLVIFVIDKRIREAHVRFWSKVLKSGRAL